MKKLLLLVLCALILLAGCSDSGARTVEGAVIIDSLGVRLDIPQDWSVYTGKDIYDEIYPQYSDSFDSAEELRKFMLENGEEYIAYAASADSGAILLVSTQEAGEASLDELARSLHDGTLFDYLASDFRTGSNSVFDKREIAGKEGWLSFFEIYLPHDEEREFVLAQELFMFECGGRICSVQTVYSDKESTPAIENIMSVIDNG